MIRLVLFRLALLALVALGLVLGGAAHGAAFDPVQQAQGSLRDALREARSIEKLAKSGQPVADQVTALAESAGEAIDRAQDALARMPEPDRADARARYFGLSARLEAAEANIPVLIRDAQDDEHVAKTARDLRRSLGPGLRQLRGLRGE